MNSIRVLIVEGDLAEARILEEAVLEIAETAVSGAWCGMEVLHASDLAEAIAQIKGEDVHVVLLNPNLIGSQGFDTFRKLKQFRPGLPFVLIVDKAEDLDLARKAVREGAQDYLLRSNADSRTLAHAIETSIERSRLTRALWNAFQFDDFTGLLNRAGFLYVAELIRNVLTHLNEPIRLLVAQLEGRNRKPSEEGLDVLIAADLIRGCMDSGDVLGRTSPTQFCILSPALTLNMVQARIDNAQPSGEIPRLRWSELEASPSSEQAVEALLVAAEEGLMEQKASVAAVH